MTIDFLRDWKNESRMFILLMMAGKGGVEVGSKTDNGRFAELYAAGYAEIVDGFIFPTEVGYQAWEDHRERLAIAGDEEVGRDLPLGSTWTRIGLLPDVVDRIVSAPKSGDSDIAIAPRGAPTSASRRDRRKP